MKISSLHILESRVLRELPNQAYERVFIAYSGGRDSTVLLHSCAVLRQQNLLRAPLAAWHINHHILSQSNEWEAHCIRKCRTLAIPLQVSRLHIKAGANESMEMAARRERYAIWEKELPADCLLLQAHHERDQVETLLLRLFRGSRSLYAMPQQRRLGGGLLHRPLLKLSDAEIAAYQKDGSLQYVEDDSNQDTKHDRNFIRHSVLPLVTKRWRRLEPNLAGTAERLEAHTQGLELLKRQLLDEHARDDRLVLASALAMKPSLFEFLIRSWLEMLNFPIPSPALISQIHKQAAARQDAVPSLRWEGAEIHRYEGCLYAMPSLPAIRNKDDGFIINPTQHPYEEYPLRLGSLVIKEAEGNETDAQGGELRVSYRQGGERLKRNTKSRPLKKLLQEEKIPPWLRTYIPLVYCAKKLVAVPRVGEDADFQRKNGLAIDWRVDAIYGAPPREK